MKNLPSSLKDSRSSCLITEHPIHISKRVDCSTLVIQVDVDIIGGKAVGRLKVFVVQLRGEPGDVAAYLSLCLLVAKIFS